MESRFFNEILPQKIMRHKIKYKKSYYLLFIFYALSLSSCVQEITFYMIKNDNNLAKRYTYDSQIGSIKYVVMGGFLMLGDPSECSLRSDFYLKVMNNGTKDINFSKKTFKLESRYFDYIIKDAEVYIVGDRSINGSIKVKANEKKEIIIRAYGYHRLENKHYQINIIPVDEVLVLSFQAEVDSLQGYYPNPITFVPKPTNLK
jgi:hypothetical protein